MVFLGNGGGQLWRARRRVLGLLAISEVRWNATINPKSESQYCAGWLVDAWQQRGIDLVENSGRVLILKQRVAALTWIEPTRRLQATTD
jgi:hypothetical protein